eukprot:gene3981-4530_t
MTAEAEGAIRNAAELLKDDSLLLRVGTGGDFIAREVVYHHSSRKSRKQEFLKRQGKQEDIEKYTVQNLCKRITNHFTADVLLMQAENTRRGAIIYDCKTPFEVACKQVYDHKVPSIADFGDITLLLRGEEIIKLGPSYLFDPPTIDSIIHGEVEPPCQLESRSGFFILALIAVRFKAKDMSMAASSSSSDNDTESSLLDKEVACEEKNAAPDDKVKKRGGEEEKTNTLPNDDLRMFIVNYTTGGRRINRFWGKINEELYKPDWWPKSVPFTSPNIRERDATEALSFKLYLRVECICFRVSDWKSETLENSHHIVDANEVVAETLLTKDAVASDDEDNEEPSQLIPEETDKKQELASIKVPPRSVERATDLKKKTEAIMSKKHLLTIADTRWESFLRKVSKIDKNFVERCKIFLSGHQDEFTMCTMPSSVSVIDELYNNLDIVPDGMQVLTATGNGDCLFNSVGKLLFGTEAVTPILRLVAAVDGIDHAEHFVNEYRDLYITRDSALQMLYVFSTAKTYARRPSSSTATIATSILRFAIRSEIMELTFQRSFAGLLQVRLLGTSLYRNVNLHCSYSDFYHGLMSPCICRQQLIERPLNVMFVGASKDLKEPNHYVPLVWKISPRNFPENLQEQKIATKFCAGRKLLGCIAVSGEKKEWVQCRKCYLHYHAVCSGIAVHKKEFVCCLEKDICIELQRGNMNLLAHHFDDAVSILEWPEAVSKPKSCESVVIISLFDIFCLHSFGFSSSLVNFYIRVLQNIIVPNSNVFVANTEDACQIFASNSCRKPIFPRDNILSHDIVIFPCVLRMSVLDSMGETSCERQWEMLIAFINAEQRKQAKPVTKFNLISNKIPKQVASMDCGTFMLYYISCVMKMDFRIIDSTIHIDETNSHEVGRNIRTSILRHIYDLRK